MLITLVLHANQDVESVIQQQIVQHVSLWQLLLEMDHAIVHPKLTLLFQLMESDIVLLVELTVMSVLIQIPAQLVLLHTQKQLITNVCVLQDTILMQQPILAYLVLMDVINVHQQPTVKVAQLLSFSKEPPVK